MINSRWQSIGAKSADYFHKGIVTILAVGCAFGTVNLSLGMYHKYTTLTARKNERLQQKTLQQSESGSDASSKSD
ncbi:hypothetical protein MIR68_009448 [Amoeboaphelidium protococcarum]|nr:hypothetical protein MIR68_009448 [Amoeboaphelidium protococcarum]